MKNLIKVLAMTVLFAAMIAFGQTTAMEKGAWAPGQAAADALKTYASTDGAFLAAGLLKPGYQKSADLSTMLLYPDDQVLVLALTGAQIRQAFERSVSLYPQPNASFLQISGFNVTFNKNGAVGKRIVNVTVNGSPLNDGQTYMIAMPSSLGHGGLGYFRIWDNSDIKKTLPGTIEAALKGKPFVTSQPRWSVQL